MAKRAATVDTQTWAEWRTVMWDQLERQFGYPGLAALEQYMWRSHAETRCVECGDPGTVKHERSRVSLVQSIPFYWMCADCAEYWRSKN